VRIGTAAPIDEGVGSLSGPTSSSTWASSRNVAGAFPCSLWDPMNDSIQRRIYLSLSRRAFWLWGRLFLRAPCHPAGPLAGRRGAGRFLAGAFPVRSFERRTGTAWTSGHSRIAAPTSRGFEWTPLHVRTLIDRAGGDSAGTFCMPSPSRRGRSLPAEEILGQHVLVLGATGVGKTRMLELLAAQAIRRGTRPPSSIPRGCRPPGARHRRMPARRPKTHPVRAALPRIERRVQSAVVLLRRPGSCRPRRRAPARRRRCRAVPQLRLGPGQHGGLGPRPLSSAGDAGELEAIWHRRPLGSPAELLPGGKEPENSPPGPILGISGA